MSYTTFLKRDEIVKLETDMEEGQYGYWLEKYPKEVDIIFACHMDRAPWTITNEVIDTYQKYQVNFQVHSDEYGETERLLDLIAERRDFDLFTLLLSKGAQVEDKFDIVISAIMGHGARNLLKEPEQAKKIIALLGLSPKEKEEFKTRACDYVDAKDHSQMMNLF